MQLELINSFQDTQKKSNSFWVKHSTLKAMKHTEIYYEQFQSNVENRNHTADIIVEENTTFSAARKYKQFGKVAVLNFANPEVPGGGVQNGAMAQEECLCRSSNLYACIAEEKNYKEYYGYHRSLDNRYYSERVIYSKGVLVFKTDDLILQKLPKSKWIQLDVITCAAPYLRGICDIDNEELKGIFKKRIKNIFEVAKNNQIEVLVLGAFGCGAFKNPPRVVAAAFNEVIHQNGYINYFTKIIFAIKNSNMGKSADQCENLREFNKNICVKGAYFYE